jgi:hypothetical protein
MTSPPHVIAPAGAIADSNDFVFSVWVRPHGVVAGWGTLLHKGDGEWDRQLGIWLAPGTSQVYACSSSVTNNDNCVYVATALPLHQWTLVTVVRSTYQLRVFYNNAPMGSLMMTAPLFNTGALHAGDAWYSSANADMFNVRYCVGVAVVPGAMSPWLTDGLPPANIEASVSSFVTFSATGSSNSLLVTVEATGVPLTQTSPAPNDNDVGSAEWAVANPYGTMSPLQWNWVIMVGGANSAHATTPSWCMHDSFTSAPGAVDLLANAEFNGTTTTLHLDINVLELIDRCGGSAEWGPVTVAPGPNGMGTMFTFELTFCAYAPNHRLCSSYTYHTQWSGTSVVVVNAPTNAVDVLENGEVTLFEAVDGGPDVGDGTWKKLRANIRFHLLTHGGAATFMPGSPLLGSPNCNAWTIVSTTFADCDIVPAPSAAPTTCTSTTPPASIASMPYFGVCRTDVLIETEYRAPTASCDTFYATETCPVANTTFFSLGVVACPRANDTCGCHVAAPANSILAQFTMSMPVCQGPTVTFDTTTVVAMLPSPYSLWGDALPPGTASDGWFTVALRQETSNINVANWVLGTECVPSDISVGFPTCPSVSVNWTQLAPHVHWGPNATLTDPTSITPGHVPRVKIAACVALGSNCDGFAIRTWDLVQQLHDAAYAAGCEPAVGDSATVTIGLVKTSWIPVTGSATPTPTPTSFARDQQLASTRTTITLALPPVALRGPRHAAHRAYALAAMNAVVPASGVREFHTSGRWAHSSPSSHMHISTTAAPTSDPAAGTAGPTTAYYYGGITTEHLVVVLPGQGDYLYRGFSDEHAPRLSVVSIVFVTIFVVVLLICCTWGMHTSYHAPRHGSHKLY